MRQYHELLDHILSTGNFRGDRTGTGTQSVFGYQLRCNLEDGFPLLTTKRLPFKTIVTELLWFLRGDTNIKYLLGHGVHIWSSDAMRVFKKTATGVDTDLNLQGFESRILEDPYFAKKWGDLGPVYGKQWRNWTHLESIGRDEYYPKNMDQIQQVIDNIRKNPEGRRHIVTAWNPAEIDSMALPPCHCMFQFYVSEGRLSCHMYQRSADVFLGVPFNIASYALLTHIISHQTNLHVGDLIISYGDVHIYNNHRDQIAEQLTRTLLPLPTVAITEGKHWEELEPSDFALINYDPHPAIKGDLSVG